MAPDVESDRGRRRQSEQIEDPAGGHFFHDGGGRRHHPRERILVPGARQPVRRERGGQCAAGHEPEVARAGARDDARVREAGQVLDHLVGGQSLPGQRPAQGGQQSFARGQAADVPSLDALEVAGSQAPAVW